jgi:hypothetical protein
MAGRLYVVLVMLGLLIPYMSWNWEDPFSACSQAGDQNRDRERPRGQRVPEAQAN